MDPEAEPNSVASRSFDQGSSQCAVYDSRLQRSIPESHYQAGHTNYLSITVVRACSSEKRRRGLLIILCFLTSADPLIPLQGEQKTSRICVP